MMSKSKLGTLTEDQELLFQKIADRYIAELTEPPPFDRAPVLAWLDVAYGLYDRSRPARVEIVKSPHAALLLASELTGEAQTTLDWCGVGNGGWVAFYEYFATIGVLTAEEIAPVLALRDFGRVAWDSVLLDECAIVILRPSRLRVDDDGNLHALDGPAIEWGDGERDYAYHGTWIPERFVADPRGHSRAEYLDITNTEERRALSEIAGWDWVVSLLGGSITDTYVDPATSLRYELLSLSDGQRLLRKQSPPLQDGSQPLYLEPVHEELVTARAARKWQATTLSPAECERGPELLYSHES